MNRFILITLLMFLTAGLLFALRWNSLPCVVKKDLTLSGIESRYNLPSYFSRNRDSLHKVVVYYGFFSPVKRIRKDEELRQIKESLVSTDEKREPGFGFGEEKIYFYDARKNLMAFGAKSNDEWLIRTNDGWFKLKDEVVKKLK